MPPRARDRTPTSPSPSPEPPLAGERREVAGDAPAAGPPGTASSALGPQDHGVAGAGAAAGAGVGATVMAGPTTTTSLDSGLHQVLPRPASEAARLELVDRVRLATEELYQLMMCASEIHEGAEDVIRIKINETMQTLQHVQDASTQPDLSQLVPDKVMAMVDQGRNPDIHTRNFVNRLVGDNQQLRGQLESFDLYRDTLRSKLASAFPEMTPDLEAIDAKALPVES